MNKCTQTDVPNCTNNVHKVTKLVDKVTVSKFFSAQNENTEPESAMDEGAGLCKEHYGAWYRHINPFHTKCKTCDKTITDVSKSRACPEPDLIQKHLQENTDFSGQISTEDRVCYACYRSHLFIIKHLNRTVHSTDSDLGSLIDRIKQDIPEVSDIQTLDQALTYASTFSAIQVGEALLKQTAVLLPSVYKVFRNKVMEITQLRGIMISRDIESFASASWLRSQLSSVLEHHMAYRCSVKRYGTLLYRYGGDLIHALNVSLGQSRTQVGTSNDSKESDFQNNLTKTCLSLNAKCHACIQKLVRQDATCPHNIEDFDVEKFISELDPDIWKAVCLLTQPLSPRAIKNDSNSNIRKIRRLFCVCTLFFTANSQCSFPLHTLLADAIETCGGSSRLTRLLNRLGACASADTHARYVQYRVQKSKEEGPMSGYPNNSFMIASADNLDYIHSYARIYCGNQQSSWHGTTVQLVQPQPSNLVNTIPTQQLEVNRQTYTHAQVTTNIGTAEPPVIRHPQTPASGTLETQLQGLLSKRSHSMLSPINSPGKRSPLPK